jgi:hypothetical protein
MTDKATILKNLVMSVYDIQHVRIIEGNRYSTLGIDTDSFDFLKHIENAEISLKNLIKEKVTEFPIHLWIIEQKGISYDMAGQMIGLIGDIGKFANVSKLWAYSGMGVMQICTKCNMKYLPEIDRLSYIDKTSTRLEAQYEKKIVKSGPKPDFEDKAHDMLCWCEDPELKDIGQRRVKGVLLDYNPQLKSLVWRYGKQFVMQGDFYRKLFDKFKAEYAARPDLVKEMETKAGKKSKHGTSSGRSHINAMAQRKTQKIFLQHLWVTWRKSEGLPVTMPWIIEKGGHSSYIEPPGPKL